MQHNLVIMFKNFNTVFIQNPEENCKNDNEKEPLRTIVSVIQKAWIHVDDINNLNTAIHVHKVLNNLIPSPITFEYRVVGPYNLRRGEPLTVPFVRSKQSQRFLPVRGANLWNELSHDIKSSRTLFTYKRKLKQYYLHQYT